MRGFGPTLSFHRALQSKTAPALAAGWSRFPLLVLTIRDGLPKICPLPSRYSIVAYASDFVESKQRFDRAEP